MYELTTLPQPVIARVHGIATAAGCQLVSMCDLAVAADSATFALPGINIGVFCSTPAVGVARNIGRKRAMEMLLTGDMVDAQTALAWLGKQAFYQQIEQPLEDAYEMTSETMACNLLLDDAAEGMDAFLARRPAVWQGR